ncbi:hybrid sensor histidine kinase/response regulator transcription factor [Hyunsoonleella flava]|uniref:hybrid sensor histidine kinase/response regulator transcription factor n=1 Tax=Hyunsoonleella flava TaxID=2527939 RepID=UPI0013EEF076|nr:hybrid sensor histidine kinase/response regulator transcription factor [Hyunsoonleella flava]
MKFYRYLLLAMFFLSMVNGYSQIDFTALKFNTVENNIFQRPITSIVRDRNGFLWIGTDGAGLYKYNGFSYNYYGHNIEDVKSVNSNSITALFLDGSGQLWIGTDAGLCAYNEKQNSFNRYNHSYFSGLENGYISILSFAEYEERLLVGTYDGIMVLDVESGMLKDYGLEGQGILDMKFSAKGNLYAATNYGLNVERYHQLGEFEEISLGADVLGEHITSLHIDKQEILWIGTLKNGTYKGDLKKSLVTFDKLDIVDSATMAITSGLDHTFISVENEGLFVLDQTGEIVKHYLYSVTNLNGVGSDSVWSMYLDDEKRLWLGYYENGLGFFDEHYSKFESIDRKEDGNSIHTNEIKAFAKTGDGNIWIAQINGIDVLNTNNGFLTNIYGKQSSEYKGLKRGLYIEDVFIDSKGNAWVATWGEGLFFLKKGSKTFVNFNKVNTYGALKTNKVKCFAEDSTGKVWIGSFLEGIFYFDYSTGKIHSPSGEFYASSELVDKDVKVIHNDSSGHIWIGTSSGLYQIENRDNEYVVTAHNDSISSKFAGHPSSNRILDIYETQDGTVWCGTNGGGLFEYKRDKKSFESFELEGFDLSFVNTIYEPVKNELWVSSKQGILKINRETKDVVQFTIYDGLLENFLADGAAILDNNNNLYLGTKSGVNIINPQNISYNPYLAKPYLKDVKLFNKKVNKRDKDSPLAIKSDTNVISLRHDQRVITIDYGAVSFTRPEKNQYAYLLEGFEHEWNYVGSKMNATYTNLEPGDYTFKLKASNNDNIWNDASAILKIQVQSPWWKTIWAYIAYIICFGVLVIVGMHSYRKYVNERNTFRLERERRKQKVELQQQKLQFFTNISHEFRTPLTLIINPIKELIEKHNSEASKSVQQKYHIIYKNAERLSRLINELMDFRKLQSNKLQLRVSEFNIVKSTKSILSFFNEESKRRSIQLDLKYESIDFAIWADKGILDKVLFNLLSNAFKVTPNKGKIRVKISSKNKKILPLIDKDTPIPVIEISVKDNGPGIDQKDYNRIFERFYQVGQLNKSYYGSTGVGLDMVKNFIKLHKGLIEVESELGKGSSFKVFLPYEREYFKDEEFSSKLSDKIEQLPVASKSKVYDIEDILSKKELKKKLLIVEDNVDLQDYLVSVLKEEYDLVLASDGQEGWLKTMEHSPDIIISDLIMPIMDGIEFCKKVKNDPNLSRIPLVMLTAKNLSEDRIKAIKGGADAYIVKPFDNDELMVVLEELLAKSEKLSEKYANTAASLIEEKRETDLDNDFIQKVLGFIYENIENPDLNVEKLSSHLCLSRSQVYRKIKTLTGLSPIQFIRRVRLERSKVIFQNDKNLNVSEVAHKVGFLSASYFTVCYKKQFGELPKSRKSD